MSDDWADRAAAQIMIAAFTEKNAREQIAHLLRLTRIEGQLAGVNEARQIVRDGFDKQQTTGGAT